MNQDTNEHVVENGRDYAATPSIFDGSSLMLSVLPELDAAQVKLDMFARHLGQADGDSDARLFDMGRRRLCDAIDNMADGVVMANEEGYVEIANPAAKNLLGLEPQSSLADVKAAMENMGLKHLFLPAWQTPSKTAGEFMGKASGRILQMKWNAIIDGENRFGGNVVILRDTTAQMALDKAQTEFIAAISHELRTPLTTMQNSISNMLAGVTGKITSKTAQYLATMESDCHRLGRLINDLLDMAKLEAGKMHINRSATNLADAADKAIRAFAKSAAEKELSLELNADGGISRVYVDPQRIYQVFTNLITNAIKYTPGGGRIWISIFEREDDVVSVVEDTGIGISPDRQPHIFAKFYQIARQAGPGYNGSGLGLSLSKEIVAAHGGKMWVESREGKGSKFYFSLPKVKPQIILRKHLNALAERSNKKGEQFAMLVVRLEATKECAQQNKQAIDAAMKQIMLIGDEITPASSDLVVRSGELEATIVLSQTGKRFLKHVKQRLRDSIYGALSDYRCNCCSILPMLGVALYPNDASTVEALETKAVNELNRLL